MESTSREAKNNKDDILSRRQPLLLGAAAFGFGWYLGYFLLALVKLTGWPRLTSFQLVNFAVYFGLGALVYWILKTLSGAKWQYVLGVSAVLGLFAAVVKFFSDAVDGRQHSANGFLFNAGLDFLHTAVPAAVGTILLLSVRDCLDR